VLIRVFRKFLHWTKRSSNSPPLSHVNRPVIFLFTLRFTSGPLLTFSTKILYEILLFFYECYIPSQFHTLWFNLLNIIWGKIQAQRFQHDKKRPPPTSKVRRGNYCKTIQLNRKKKTCYNVMMEQFRNCNSKQSRKGNQQSNTSRLIRYEKHHIIN
jgi:hypothetical protein